MLVFGILDHLGCLLYPSWIIDGSIMDPSRNHLGSILDPSWILDGSTMDPSSNHLGLILDPSRIIDGSTLDPSWNHLGSTLDPSWILDGSTLDHQLTATIHQDSCDAPLLVTFCGLIFDPWRWSDLSRQVSRICSSMNWLLCGDSLGDSYPHDFVFRHKRYPMMTARAIARDISWFDFLSSVPPDTAPPGTVPS